MNKTLKIGLHVLALAVLGAGLVLLKNPQLLLGNNVVTESISEPAKLTEPPHTDVKNSPYYKTVDVYNLRSHGSLTVLSHFPTRQQRTGYTCAPVAAQMVLDYYHSNGVVDELTVGKTMGTNKFNGTNVAGMAKFFEQLNWKVIDSRKTPGPKTYDDFRQWVRTNLSESTPIIVENVDWGGHWRVIIGFDDMGTQIMDDDVLILADPFDSTDHVRDGYNITAAARFYYMWFDHKLYPSGEQDKIYLIARPH